MVITNSGDIYMSIKDEGLKIKYNITHADGTPVDPDKRRFVLNIDSKDEDYKAASRLALYAFAENIEKVNPQLYIDILAWLATDLADFDAFEKKMNDKMNKRGSIDFTAETRMVGGALNALKAIVASGRIVLVYSNPKYNRMGFSVLAKDEGDVGLDIFAPGCCRWDWTQFANKMKASGLEKLASNLEIAIKDMPD